MKNSIRLFGAATMCAAALTLNSLAQEAVTQTTTSSDGTITQFSPDSVVIHSETSTSPITYSYTKQTTVVDESGNPVDISVVKTGVPVHVFYDQDGDRMVARKIVVVHHMDDAAAPVVEPPVIIKKSTTTTTTNAPQ
jgi:hypothetical protein